MINIVCCDYMYVVMYTIYRPFDAWGNRVDELVTSPAWKRMHDISAEEGLVALAYERKHHQWRWVGLLLYLVLTDFICLGIEHEG